MNSVIGIRNEDKYVMEKRVPLTPLHIQRIKKQLGIKVIVETSQQRIFSDDEFIKAGIEIKSDLKDCPVIFGIKEIPNHKFEYGKTYIFFSHVIPV